MKSTLTFVFARSISTLILFISLSGCEGDNNQASVSAGERVVSMMPSSSKSENRELVSMIAEQNNTNSGQVVSELSGYWTGNMSLGGMNMKVSASINNDGTISLTPVDPGVAGFMVRNATINQDRFTGDFIGQSIAGTQRFSIDGLLSPTRLEAYLLPEGWTWAEVESGSLRFDDSNSDQFGELNLERANLINKLTVSEMANLQWLPSIQSGYAALNIDENGNFAASIDGCQMTGALTESSSIPGALSFAVAGGDNISSCSLLPLGSAESMSNGQLLLDNDGYLVASIQSSDGKILSTRFSLEDLVSGRLTEGGL